MQEQAANLADDGQDTVEEDAPVPMASEGLAGTEKVGTQRATVGRIVMYNLTDEDAIEINRRREAYFGRDRNNWPEGAQAHQGNSENDGNTLPMMIVRVWNDKMVNGQVFLDGNDTLWVTSVELGDSIGNWFWPQRN